MMSLGDREQVCDELTLVDRKGWPTGVFRACGLLPGWRVPVAANHISGLTGLEAYGARPQLACKIRRMFGKHENRRLALAGPPG